MLVINSTLALCFSTKFFFQFHLITYTLFNYIVQLSLIKNEMYQIKQQLMKIIMVLSISFFQVFFVFERRCLKYNDFKFEKYCKYLQQK